MSIARKSWQRLTGAWTGSKSARVHAIIPPSDPILRLVNEEQKRNTRIFWFHVAEIALLMAMFLFLGLRNLELEHRLQQQRAENEQTLQIAQQFQKQSQSQGSGTFRFTCMPLPVGINLSCQFAR